MIKLLKKLFGIENKEHKNFSFTTETTSEGVDTKEELDNRLQQILATKAIELKSEDLNYLLEKVYNLTAIDTLYFKLNSTLLTTCLFEIDSVNRHISVDKKGVRSLTNLELVLKDSLYGYDLRVVISAPSFKEVFIPFKLKDHRNDDRRPAQTTNN